MTERAAMWTAFLALMAAIAGIAAGFAVGAARPWFTTLVAVVVVLEARWSWETTTQPGWDRRNRLRLRRFEVGGLLIGAKLLHLATSGSAGMAAEFSRMPGSILDRESVTAILLGLAVWNATVGSLRDMSSLGVPTEGLDAGYIGPIDNLGSRFFRGGFMVSALAGIGVVGWDGILDFRRPVIHALLLPALAWFVLGLIAMGRASNVDRHLVWEREGATIDPRIAGRWTAGVVVIVGLGLSVTLAVRALFAPLGDVPELVIIGVGRTGEWVINLIAGIRAALAGDDAAQPPDGSPTTTIDQSPLPTFPTASGSDSATAERARSLVALAVGVGIVVFIVRRMRWERRRLGQMGVKVGASQWAKITLGALIALPAAVWRFVESVGRWLWLLFRRPDGKEEDDLLRPSVQPGAGSGLSGVRGDVVTTYRLFLDEASPVIGSRKASETAEEYGHRAESAMPPEPVHRLTRVFEDARYGSEEPDQKQADLARDALDELERETPGDAG